MKIAIVRLSAIGDIIQSAVVLQFIKRDFPQAKIDWFVDENYVDLFNNVKHIDTVIGLKTKDILGIRIISKLVKLYKFLDSFGEYDLLIDLQGLIKSSIVARFISSKQRFGFDRNSCRESLASYFYSRTFAISYDKNVVERYCDLVSKSLNIKISRKDISNKDSIFMTTKFKERVNSKNFIIFILGASFKSKIYPIEKYSFIANEINTQFVAVWNTLEERRMALKLCRMSNNVINIETKNFDELKEIIYQSSLIIGGDTGPTHLAWSMNKASITIFGCTPMHRNFFPTRINLAISSESKVDAFKIDKNDFSIRDIDPKKLINLINTLSEQ